jgi:hypothetical protein
VRLFSAVRQKKEAMTMTDLDRCWALQAFIQLLTLSYYDSEQ